MFFISWRQTPFWYECNSGFINKLLTCLVACRWIRMRKTVPVRCSRFYLNGLVLKYAFRGYSFYVLWKPDFFFWHALYNLPDYLGSHIRNTGDRNLFHWNKNMFIFIYNNLQLNFSRCKKLYRLIKMNIMF